MYTLFVVISVFIQPCISLYVIQLISLSLYLSISLSLYTYIYIYIYMYAYVGRRPRTAGSLA